MTRTLFSVMLTIMLACAIPVFGQTQTAQTKKQSLPEQPGFVLQDGTVYTVDKTMTLDGNSTGGFINGLAVAENATVTLYIPSGVTLTVYGQDADGQHGAGAGIYVPSTSTLYITGEGSLIAQGGNGANGGAGTDGGDGNVSGQTAHSGAGGDGGYGGGGAAAAIGGNGGDGGGTTSGAISMDSRRGTGGANGLPALPTSTDYNGKNGVSGTTMGNVYILGKVTVQTTAGVSGLKGGSAGVHGTAKSKNNKGENWGGGGGAGAGGGAGIGASFGIGGGGAGAGGGAAGGSGAADSNTTKNFSSQDSNAKGNASSATGYGEGAVNGDICDDSTNPRDNGGVNATDFLRFGGYGGSLGGKAGAQGDNGAVYVEANSETDLTGATIGNKVVMSVAAEETALSALNVDIKLNFLNDGNPTSGVLKAKFGEPYEQLPNALIPTRPGYDFVGYFTQAVGGDQVFQNDGTPATTGARCLYVQGENPTLYAHWILSTYTITWKYDYYSVDAGGIVSIPESERSYQANVIIRLTDGTTHNMLMENPKKTQTEYTHTVTLREVLSDEIFNKVVAVEKVVPVEIGSTNKVLMTLDYVSESSAKIFYDPTRYMVKWNVSVNTPTTEKPEYIILTVKRGITNDTADGDIPTDGDYAEDANIFRELRIRKNADGKYSGSAVLKYEQDASNAFHYSVSVVGVRDDSGHEYMFPTAVSSKGETDGIMYCSKPSEQNPNPSRNIDEIKLTVNLKQLTFNPNGGTLNDGSPEDIWAPTGTEVALKSGETSYPYTATRLNYNFEGWATTKTTTVGLDNITLSSDQTVYAVFMDRTPPTITFGDYTRNGTGNNYRVPVTISDAVSTQNVVYYTVFDTNPGDTDIDWGTQKGKTSKKAEVVNIDFTSTSVVYVHVKAVDESGNAAIASKEIKVDSEAPVIRAYPNVDSFCAVGDKGVDVDVIDNVGITDCQVKPNTGVTITSTVNTLYSIKLPKSTSYSTEYTITATDAAGNKTERTITIYAAHDWTNGTDIAATEPTETSEGYYRYKKCAHCSHIILLRGNSQNEIDITNESQRGAWIIPAGAVMLMEPFNGDYDIVDYDTYINTALTKTNTVTSATQVRLSKDTQIANSGQATLVEPNRAIDLELNGHGILLPNGTPTPGNVTGNGKVTILLTDNGTIPYTNKSTVTSTSPIRYDRYFSSVQSCNWQSLFIPVDFTYTENEDYELAKLIDNDKVTMNEGAAEGSFVLRIQTLTYNTPCTKNTSYFIRSKKKADEGKTIKVSITAKSEYLPAAKAWADDSNNASGSFTFSGGTQFDSPVSGEGGKANFWVMLNNGTMWWAAEGQTQRPYRWVIQPTGTAPANIRFVMVEKDETDIKDVEAVAGKNAANEVYTLDGRKLRSADNLSRGIYIINGKKVFIK